jgi:hypothetical protein
MPIAGGIVGAEAEIAFPRPTRPGDELQVVSEVTEITPSRSTSDKGIVVLRNETRNQRGEVVLVLTAKLVVPRKPQTPASRATQHATMSRGRQTRTNATPVLWLGMIDRNSCVTGKWSISTRSLVISNQRARRSGRLCRAFQAAA